MPNFAAKGRPLTDAGLTAARNVVQVGLVELWTVISVETSGAGFLPDRRPKILFERHYFSRLTQGKYDVSHPDISQPSWGGWGVGGAHQYDRLNAAIALNETAALKSASWGLGQVLGNNHQIGGFATVNALVEEMVASEDAQLRGMMNFISRQSLGKALQDHDWTAFALKYNGSRAIENNYPTSLEKAHARLSAGSLPDLKVRTAQVYLTYLGFKPGPIDGDPGDKTRSAVAQYRTAHGMGGSSVIDDALLASLAAAA